jgi:hypothetical protein
MAFAIQLDLLETVDQHTLIQKELEAMRESNANVRRGVFARVTTLAEIVVKQQEQIDALTKLLASD